MPDTISYDRAEMRGILRAFKTMDEEAARQAKEESGKIADFAVQRIQAASHAYGLGGERVALGAKVSKSSKIGEMNFGYRSQRFSGGGSTQDLWPGLEFGSSRFPQFGSWAGRYGSGSKGRFIFPTLRRIQPDLVRRWENAFSDILKKWG